MGDLGKEEWRGPLRLEDTWLLETCRSRGRALGIICGLVLGDTVRYRTVGRIPEIPSLSRFSHMKEGGAQRGEAYWGTS